MKKGDSRIQKFVPLVVTKTTTIVDQISVNNISLYGLSNGEELLKIDAALLTKFNVNTVFVHFCIEFCK